VVIGAHYDHLGYGERGSLAREVKAIHYGADDNASGTVAVLELARRFAEMRDRQGRRLVFIFFSGEEQGLLGSRHYCNNPIFPLEKTAVMVNFDMVGRLRDDKLTVYGTGTAKGFDKLIDELGKKHGFQIGKVPSGFGPSDHASFYSRKIPVFHLFTGTHAQYHRPHRYRRYDQRSWNSSHCGYGGRIDCHAEHYAAPSGICCRGSPGEAGCYAATRATSGNHAQLRRQ
jgi:Zn-dependent M28 family amino/carboxypeptidase